MKYLGDINKASDFQSFCTPSSLNMSKVSQTSLIPSKFENPQNDNQVSGKISRASSPQIGARSLTSKRNNSVGLQASRRPAYNIFHLIKDQSSAMNTSKPNFYWPNKIHSDFNFSKQREPTTMQTTYLSRGLNNGKQAIMNTSDYHYRTDYSTRPAKTESRILDISSQKQNLRTGIVPNHTATNSSRVI